MSVAENLIDIQARIDKSAAAYARESGDVRLVAVSKKQSDARIEEALVAGQRVFGENRVQEAQMHWGDLKQKYKSFEVKAEAGQERSAQRTHFPQTELCKIKGGEGRDIKNSGAGDGGNRHGRDTGNMEDIIGSRGPGNNGTDNAGNEIKLHLIGPLQTNKVRDAVALFDVIETVDREKLARALAKEMGKQGRDLPCFIQVNTGEEPQKSGVLPEDLGAFYDVCYEECGLDIQGLMCIPPVDEPSALHFALLAKLAEGLGLKSLSMGMSSDFEKAIPLGATHIRVGTGVFGEREG